MPAPASTPNHSAGTSAVRRANASRNSRKPLAARIPIAPIAGSASCGILPSERTLRSTGDGAPGTSGRGQPQGQRGGDPVDERGDVHGSLPADGRQGHEADRGRAERARDRDPAETGVRPHQTFLLRGVRHRQAVLHDAVHAREDQHHEHDGEQQVRRQLRRQVEGQHAAPGGGGERDRSTRPRAVQDRHDQRSRQRERQHRQPQEQRDPDARFGDRHVEEHRVGERDREQGIARDAREVVQTVRVDRIRRGPHPWSGCVTSPWKARTTPSTASCQAGIRSRRVRGGPHPGGYPCRRSRRTSCASFGSAVPPAFCIS